jgi:hypothetical protein
MRLLLLGKGAVLTHCSTVHSLLSWTNTSSPAMRWITRGHSAASRQHRRCRCQAKATVARTLRLVSRLRIDDCPCETGIDRFACPCCGFSTLVVTGGTAEHEICQVCFWQHDHVDEARPDESPLGPNRVPLNSARLNYASVGACEPKWVDNVRPPRPDEIADG